MLNVLHFIYLCSFTNFIHCDGKHRQRRRHTFSRDNFSPCVCVGLFCRKIGAPALSSRVVFTFCYWSSSFIYRCLSVYFSLSLSRFFSLVLCRNSRLWSCSRYGFAFANLFCTWWANCTIYKSIEFEAPLTACNTQMRLSQFTWWIKISIEFPTFFLIHKMFVNCRQRTGARYSNY